MRPHKPTTNWLTELTSGTAEISLTNAKLVESGKSVANGCKFVNDVSVIQALPRTDAMAICP